MLRETRSVGVCAGQGLAAWCPRQDSNLRHRLRRAVLYPLSYGGGVRFAERLRPERLAA